jgi:hypothetical protein
MPHQSVKPIRREWIIGRLYRAGWSSSAGPTGCAMPAPQSQAIQTRSLSTPPSSSPQRAVLLHEGIEGTGEVASVSVAEGIVAAV